MSIFLKALKGVSRLFLYIGYAAIFVLAGITVVDVFMRFVFRRPITGVTEMCQMLLIISMATLAHSLVEGRFICVGVIVERFPKKLNLALEIIMGVISFVFFVIVGYQLLVAVEFSMQFNEFYFMLRTPKWPLYIILGASFIVTAMGTIVYVIERVMNFKSASDKNVFDDNPDLAILALSEEEDSLAGQAEDEKDEKEEGMDQ